MSVCASSNDVSVRVDGHVAVLELCRPPYNYIDSGMVGAIADALHALDSVEQCRAIVLAASGKAFCAGADQAKSSAAASESTATGSDEGARLYAQAVRLFATAKPIVAAVHGAAIGGGLGLALTADFRVGCAETRLSANFTRLGLHPGFGMTATLPRLVGAQKAALLFYTGRRIGGEEALLMGLLDRVVPQADVRSAAIELATEIAQSAPLAVTAARRTLRRGLREEVEAATQRELAEQLQNLQTEDFKEGVKAMSERRLPSFQSR